MRALGVCLLVVLTAGSAGAAVTRYAGPPSANAGGACLSSSTPCSVAQALAVIACGDTLSLLDGTYTGANYLLLVNSSSTSALACSAGAPITVRAQTDGGVTIDAENSAIMGAVHLTGAAYWTVERINARRGYGTVTVRNTDHVIIRRVVAYDTSPIAADQAGNIQVFATWNSTNLLIEDVAAFGIGEQAILDFGSAAANVTWRRVWARTEGTARANGSSVSTANQFNYTSDNHPTPGLFENVIMTSAPARIGGIQYITNTMRHSALSPYVRLYGGIHYAGSSNSQVHAVALDGSLPTQCRGYIVQDSVFHHNGTNYRPIANDGSGGPCDVGATGPAQYTRVTAMKGTGPSSTLGVFGSSTNFVEDVSTVATGFNYLGASNTARLCYRYVDGVYKDGSDATPAQPLWPWPMDDRIKAAIAANTVANGATGGSSVALTGTALVGVYQANTVTSEIASIFGAIPPQCRAGGAPVPLAPSNLVVHGLLLLGLIALGAELVRRSGLMSGT